MPETTLLIKAALNLRVGAVFDVYVLSIISIIFPFPLPIYKFVFYFVAIDIFQSENRLQRKNKDLMKIIRKAFIYP